ncbi:MAG: hypothetical protein PPP56_01680, partial [Longimonas sp.]|uniref:hypothetical protein n=1 Tax=Longimonas sp. TaxID=2039626 RepID=UPI00334FAC25
HVAKGCLCGKVLVHLPSKPPAATWFFLPLIGITFFYVVVFGLWMAWAHLNENDASTPEQQDTSTPSAQAPALSS